MGARLDGRRRPSCSGWRATTVSGRGGGGGAEDGADADSVKLVHRAAEPLEIESALAGLHGAPSELAHADDVEPEFGH